MKRRIVATLLSVCMVTATLAGCASSSTTSAPASTDTSVEADSAEVSATNTSHDFAGDYASGELGSNIDIFASGSGSLDYTYADPVYGVPLEQAFEFEASDEARNFGILSFTVYTSEKDLDEAMEYYKTNGEVRAKTHAYVDTNEKGKIIVAPPGGIDVLEEGPKYPDLDNPSWGIYNRLFLTQWIDLETGEYLDKPIVTIFSIDHGIDAPIVNQTLDETNHYTLTWEPVDGAEEYAIFTTLDDHLYSFEGTTTNESFSILEFKSEQESLALFTEFIDEYTGAETLMNYQIKSDSRESHDKDYVVFAISGDLMSGLSNYVDPSDFAGCVPYEAPSGIPVYNVSSVDDIPLYLDVVMADESVSKMLIELKGAPIYELDDGTIYISTKYYNTNLQCGFKLSGITMDELSANKDAILDRLEEEKGKSGSALNNNLNISLVPTSNEDEKNEEMEALINETLGSDDDDAVEPDDDDVVEPDDDDVVEPDDDDVVEPDDDNVVEPDDDNITPNTDGPSTTVTPDGRTSMELYEDALKEIENRFDKYDIDMNDLGEVIYANCSLEAYLAYALTARMEVIPVPLEKFPEATNANALSAILFEAYRQNPSSGVISDYDFAFDYETLKISYADDTDLRLRQTKEELEKAKEVADSVCKSSMSDEEKIYALNEYFCDNASYDFDSMSTNVDMNSLSQEFIDAHTPYGILCNNYGVCESYSEAMMLTGRFAGVDVIGDFGYLNGGAHEWNRVCIDGEYYILDVTNDDMELGHNALCLVSEKQAPCLSSNKSAFYIDVKATDESKEYYAYNDLAANSKEEAIELIEEQLDKNGIANVRFAYDSSNEAIMEALDAVYADGYALDRFNIFNGVAGVNVN